MKLDVPYYAQERVYTCGPACLRTVLAFHGLLLPEADPAQRRASTVAEAGENFHFRGGPHLPGCFRKNMPPPGFPRSAPATRHWNVPVLRRTEKGILPAGQLVLDEAGNVLRSKADTLL